MAGILYLPRLFIYHTQVKVGSEESERFKVMERKLMKIIINPSIILLTLFGLWLMIIVEAWSYPWFHAKLLCLVVIFAMHGMCSKYRKAFMQDNNQKSEKFFRMINEIPAVMMVCIVILAVVKPF